MQCGNEASFRYSRRQKREDTRLVSDAGQYILCCTTSPLDVMRQSTVALCSVSLRSLDLKKVVSSLKIDQEPKRIANIPPKSPTSPRVQSRHHRGSAPSTCSTASAGKRAQCSRRMQTPMPSAAFAPLAPVATKAARSRPAARRRAPTLAVSRRGFAELAAAAVGAVLAPGAARADRTGKFSTKLTAKRRYLPRIRRGFEALAAVRVGVAGWETAVLAFVAGPEGDLKSALELFATTYFSEGNRIGAVERTLKDCEDVLYGALARLEVAAKDGDVDAAEGAYALAVRSANTYITTAKISDSVPLLS